MAAKKARGGTRKRGGGRKPASAARGGRGGGKRAGARKAPGARRRRRTPSALVTGACGFAGSHTVDLLVEKGYRVIATDLESADRRYVNPRAKFMPADVTRPETLEPLFRERPGYVFHPAAVFDYEAPWELCEKVNVEGMRNMCEIALRRKVRRFVLYSTVSVYGWPEPDELPVREENPKRPGTNYEKSKWMQEEVGMEYCERGLPVTVVRPGPVYGPRNTYGVATILFLIAKFPILPFPVNLNNAFVSVHVRDVANAAIFLSTREEAAGEAYNVVDCSDYTVREVMKYICPLMGVKVIPTFIPRDVLYVVGNQVADVSRSIARIVGGRPIVEKDMVYYLKADYSFSNEKLRSLGYEFLYPDSLPGLRETIDWYRKNNYLSVSELWMKIVSRL
ncbi:MAG: NAD(P)-dependent oxidoreductase [bacterium]